MQNFTESQTRLAFIQYIFQSEFLKINENESIEDFQRYFYNENIAVIGEKEISENSVSLRCHGDNKLISMSYDDFIKKIKNSCRIS